MRLCLAVFGTLALATFAAAGGPYPPMDSPNVKGMRVTVTMPSEVRLAKPRRPGDPVGMLIATVTLKNTTPWPVPFARHWLSWGGVMENIQPGWDRRILSYSWADHPLLTTGAVGPVFNINPGQTYTTTCKIVFADAGPWPQAETFFLSLTVYGHQVKSKINFK
ncbi:MAG TPA: hypothetical protein VH120_13890 [Gemmataceae bacterium]|jgi:hypothetical protein|nr:hypothetical protein [Gemmataceae bacterium]